MDQMKTGELIRQFRISMGLTQRELAERINVSDKAVSKWENGNGFPDVSLLSALAEVFGTDVKALLTGEIDRNDKENGDMKKIRFYVCGECGNTITATSDAAVTCCGSVLEALTAEEAKEDEKLRVEDIGGEWYITSDHPMTKDHYISFVAFVDDRSVMISRQYPEWSIDITLPIYRSGRLMWYCTKCGMKYMDLAPAPRKR